jgi:glycosyltransferase involved in cell wall biosynthesis
MEGIVGTTRPRGAPVFERRYQTVRGNGDHPGEEPLRIALVAPPWIPVPPDGYGGTEAVIDRLARGLRAAGHEVVLAAHPDSTCPVQVIGTQALPEGTPIGVAAFELRHAVEAYDCVDRLSPDIIHDHTLAGPLLCRGRGHAPVVTTNHGPFDEHTISLYRAIGSAAPVIAISHSQAAMATGVRLAGVVHHGLDVEEIPVGEGRGDYFLCLGRMTPAKGIHTAIDVARRAGVRLLIAAKMREDAEREYFYSAVEPLLGADVEFVGEVGPQDKYRLLGGARALVNPIQWPEPFGMVMLEALACGTPVVSFAQGAAPEIVDDGVTGFLRHTPDEMVAALGRVDEIDRAACRQRAQEQFSTERMVDCHVEVYRRVLAQARRRVGEAPARHLR